jgi:hypothetical protein
MTALLAHISGTAWDDWALVAGPVVIFVALAAILGRPRNGVRSPLEAAALTLERIAKVPGWVAGTVLTASGGLILAMLGFYWDVAWHIDQGRDKQLFTPPHLLILLGLGSILLAGAVAVALASATRADTRLRFRSIRIPWSAIALGAIGGGAVMGFPLDDRWHAAYGIDVTMWGPTHLIMIGGASLATVAMWLVLGEGGVRPERRTIGFVLHSMAASGSLLGLSALQGEFDFGVPQFQLLYHPVMVMAVAAIVLTAARLVLGRGGAIRAAVGFIAVRGLVALFVGGFGYTAPHFPLYLAPALAVELVALLLGTKRLGRYAIGAGIGVATIGMAGEWAWTHVWSLHPWGASLLPEAIWVGALAALGGAVLGVALGMIVSGNASDATFELPSRRTLAAVLVSATLMLGLALGLPIQRLPSNVVATVHVQQAGSLAIVDVRVSPSDGAEGAHWFEAMSWQGGGLFVSGFERVGPGHYVAKEPIPIGGNAKALIRFSRGAELSAIPIRFPADPEIGAPAIPAVDRTARFERDTKLLMREAHRGNPLTARIVFAVLGAIVLTWLIVVALAGAGIASRRPRPTVTEEPHRAAA